MTCLITQHLSRIGAYDHRDSWDDLVQEVLVSLLRTPPTSEEPAAIIRHIRTTTYRKFIDQIRRERGRRRTDPGDDQADVGWRQQVVLDEAEHTATIVEAAPDRGDEGLRKALESLGEDEREAVTCRYLLGCSNDEAARRLKVSPATYKRRLSRGMAALRERLISPEGAGADP